MQGRSMKDARIIQKRHSRKSKLKQNKSAFGAAQLGENILLLPVSNKVSTVTSARSLTRHFLFGQAPRRHCHGVEQRSPHTSAGLGILQGIERVCEEELSASFGTERPGRAPPPSQPEPGVGVL